MLGAIAGDIIGSVYEWENIKTKEFPLFSPRCRFTDDTVLTMAVADSIMSGTGYGENFKRYFGDYPHAGYGGSFRAWAMSDQMMPYHSWGNGSAMRVSPVGFAFSTLEEVLQEAKASAEVTHNHPEGVKGAQAVAAAIFLARTGESKEGIKAFIEGRFEYDLEMTLEKIRPAYSFDVSCQGSVPQAIRAFLESTDFEDAIRNAVSIGGDSDTIACITGGIAEAYYGGVPEDIEVQAMTRLDAPLQTVVKAFRERFC
ncbi:ADP-ribosylglycohydrolase family protein [Heliobacterium undosum]|uniref:ADP-ribosylglycohydrolase family protein n=1 Tax=Heliomicrobium undosum TaxID=121734 RepID=A0A845L4N3_9FIRM|nr:ADP-ribosylglycohydrolase family protein [Heliomicrobium undosum]MZP30656.1 ADP-ribosylglycohydrolase family protein [Heliomicrobium undosum]